MSTTGAPPDGDSHTLILARLSHELRTPLNSVIGFSRVLQTNRSGNQGPKDLAMLGAIRANGERLLGLVEDLMSLSVGPPVCELPISPLVNVVGIAEDVVAKWELAAESKGITIRLDTDGEAIVRADPANLHTLLSKLVSNGVKFTTAGGVVVSVSGGEAQGVPARIVISDTGIGIPPNRLASVFEPFVQVDGSTRRLHEGAGLGLPISRALADKLGCSIRVESEEGKGTVVVVEFPG